MYIAFYIKVSNDIISLPDVNTISQIIMTDSTLQCFHQLEVVGKRMVKLDTEINFIDIYHKQTEDLIFQIQSIQGKPLYLIEGVSKQGKSTFGKNLFNKVLGNQTFLAFYLPLNPGDPKNIFMKLNKCSWDNFPIAAESLQENNKTSILIIIDNIQLAF